MNEAEIIAWLHHRASDCGFKDVKITIENHEKFPVTVYINLNSTKTRVECGMGMTVDEAFKQIADRLSGVKAK